MPTYLIDRQTPIESETWGDDEPDTRALQCLLARFAAQAVSLAVRPEKQTADERRGWTSAVHVVLEAHDIALGPAPFSVWLDVLDAERQMVAKWGPCPSETQPTRPSWCTMFASQIMSIWTQRVQGNRFDPTTQG